jgi:hypothetical protein
MQRVNQYQFYSLGFILHPLSGVTQGAKLNEWYFRCLNASVWLEFISDNKLVPLGVCRAACLSLREAVDRVIATPPGTEAPDMERQISPYEAYSITNELQKFETIFSAELQSLDTYFVSQKLGYVTHDLIERAEVLLPEHVRNDIPAEAQADIRQAGKCMAFDIPTAAGFHIIRATESIIRLFYEAILNRKPKAKMRNWGAYVKNLEQGGAETRITGFINHIRESYRNPVLHPEVTLSQDDAQVLVGTCISAIVQMMSEIKKKNPVILYPVTAPPTL